MFISGIQQVGIGVANVHEAFKWYRQHFGMDVPMFEEAAEAALMLPSAHDRVVLDRTLKKASQRRHNPKIRAHYENAMGDFPILKSLSFCQVRCPLCPLRFGCPRNQTENRERSICLCVGKDFA